MKIKALIIGIAVMVIAGGTGAYALSRSDFADQASQWASRTCDNIGSSNKATSINHVVCHNYHQGRVNASAIDDLRSSGVGSSGYVLKQWNSQIGQNPGVVERELSRTIAPTDGTITTIGAVGTFEDQNINNPGGTIEFEVFVNEEYTGFSTQLDDSNVKAVNDSGDINIKAGDIVSIRVVATNLAAYSDDRPNFFHTIVLYVE